MVKLSIIVLTYNTKDLILGCIQSMIKQYRKRFENQELELIVADNASTDGTVKTISNLKSEILNLKLIQNKKNYGFGKGNNIAAKNAEGEYLLFLNSDTQVKDRGFLKMIEFLDKNPDIGILGGRLTNPDGLPQASAGSFYTLPNLFLMLIGAERIGLTRSSPLKISRVDWISGACMMVRAKLFEELKGFDENLFMYMEDVELCFRAKKKGALTYFYPNINVVHKKLGSSNRNFAIINIYRGILYFYKKHKNYWEYILAKILLTFKAIIAILIGILIGNNYLKNTYRKAIRF